MRILLMVLFLAATTQAGEWQLLRFRASWCAPCQQQKIIYEQAGIRDILKSHNVRDRLFDADQRKDAFQLWEIDRIPVTILVWVDDENKAKIVRRNDGTLMSPAVYQSFVRPPRE